MHESKRFRFNFRFWVLTSCYSGLINYFKVWYFNDSNGTLTILMVLIFASFETFTRAKFFLKKMLVILPKDCLLLRHSSNQIAANFDKNHGADLKRGISRFTALNTNRDNYRWNHNRYFKPKPLPVASHQNQLPLDEWI